VLILAAIVGLGASGLILMLLAIANPVIDDAASDSRAPSNVVPLRVITRTDGVPLARRHARPAMEVRTVVTREQEPPRRSVTRKSWWRQTRDAIDHGYTRPRRTGILASPDARFVAGTVACSLAVGLLIAHLSV
jgi:hypothetical protein